jgi:CheY-like chemotaxis protein
MQRRYAGCVVVDRPLLLVVDDDDDVRDMLAATLSDDGYDVVTAHHGLKAVELLKDGLAPDVILLDIMMPVMNGWEFWDRLQAHPTWRNVPVIVLTASGLSTGAIGSAVVLAKPVDYQTLIGALAAATSP